MASLFISNRSNENYFLKNHGICDTADFSETIPGVDGSHEPQ